MNTEYRQRTTYSNPSWSPNSNNGVDGRKRDYATLNRSSTTGSRRYHETVPRRGGTTTVPRRSEASEPQRYDGAVARRSGTTVSQRYHDTVPRRENNRSVESNSRANSNGTRTREVEHRDESVARREAVLRRRRNRKIRKIKNYIKLGITCACIGTFLAVFVFKTPIERGTKELESGKYQEAIEEFSKGLNDIDYIAESFKGIGISYYELGQYKDAAENLENAIQKGQTLLGTTYYILAISYMEIGDYSNALKNITTAITKTGNSPELIQELKYNEVLCMEYTSDWEGAKAKATSYLQSYPDDEAMKAEYDFLASR